MLGLTPPSVLLRGPRVCARFPVRALAARASPRAVPWEFNAVLDNVAAMSAFDMARNESSGLVNSSASWNACCVSNLGEARMRFAPDSGLSMLRCVRPLSEPEDAAGVAGGLVRQRGVLREEYERRGKWSKRAVLAQVHV